MAGRRGQRANKIHVDVGKTLCRNRNVLWLEVNVAVSLGSVAGGAGVAPAGDVSGEMGPDIPRGEEAARCANARVGEALHVVEEGKAQFPWDQRPEKSSGDVAMDR